MSNTTLDRYSAERIIILRRLITRYDTGMRKVKDPDDWEYKYFENRISEAYKEINRISALEMLSNEPNR